MVKFREVQEGSVVQLGRFNKTRAPLSHAVGMVTRREITKIGKNTWTGFVVQISPRKFELVALHNIKAVLA